MGSGLRVLGVGRDLEPPPASNAVASWVWFSWLVRILKHEEPVATYYIEGSR